MAEELAVIGTVHVGLRDVGQPVLWFDVTMMSGAALQVLTWDNASQFIRDSGMSSIDDINGMACIVETDGISCKFKRFKK